jgi:hypothetical protein
VVVEVAVVLVLADVVFPGIDEFEAVNPARVFAARAPVPIVPAVTGAAVPLILVAFAPVAF